MSADFGFAHLGLTDLGLTDLGLTDLGLADLGLADLGLAGIGLAGAIALAVMLLAVFAAWRSAGKPDGLLAWLSDRGAFALGACASEPASCSCRKRSES